MPGGSVAASIAEWIDQFAPPDRQRAAFLADSIVRVSATHFEKTLARLVSEVVREHSGSVALYAALPPERIARVPDPRFAVPEDPGFLKAYLRDFGIPAYFGSFANERPHAAGVGASVGSEAYVASLLRQISSEAGPHRVLDHPSLLSLKTTKCSRLVVVDDILGSGRRMLSFLQALLANRTISSWTSLRYIRATVVAYAATGDAIQRLRGCRLVDQVRTGLVIEPGRSFWTGRDLSEVKALCLRYARRTSRPRFALGFHDQLTMAVFEHSCPNTTPAILWAGRKPGRGREGWYALFPRRPSFGPLPADLNDAASRRSFALTTVGQLRLARSGLRQHLSPRGDLLLVVLAAIASRRRTPDRIADFVEVSTATAKDLLDKCLLSGWVDADFILTRAGLDELRYARQARRLPKRGLDLRLGPYYPRQLRGVRTPASEALGEN